MHVLLWFLLALTPQISALDAPVHLLGEDIPIETIISKATSHAEADLTGPGEAIELTYSSSEPLDVLVMFPSVDGGFTPLETLQAHLPEGQRVTAAIHLTESPGWSPLRKQYRLHFLTESQTGVEFHDVNFVRGSFISSITSSVKQFLGSQPYSPSSYHRLPGYRIAGISFGVLFGFLLIVLSLWFAWKKQYQRIILGAIILTLLSHARFSVDAVRYSLEHSRRDYATAGSLFQIVDWITEHEVTGVALCNDGTTYAEKLLSYHIYPLLLTEDPSHVVVYRAVDTSFNGTTLRCGKEQFSASKLKDFPDGSSLYSVDS